MTEIKAAMAMAKQRQILKEKERIINSFAVSPTIKCKAVTKVTKLILLNSPIYSTVDILKLKQSP